jgi:prepilin-type N-terminal cleavage/methylation domain-containing protein
MIKKLRKNNKGMTLLEMIVALGIFSIFMLSATAIFQSVVESQRTSFAGQNAQESMRYALEVMAREIRSAQRDEVSSVCPPGWNLLGKIYKTNDGEQLWFKNKYGQCVSYSLNSNRLRITRDGGGSYGYITPDEVKITNIKFIIDEGAGIQSKVTFKIGLEVIGKAINKQEMGIQTTVSSRYYE